MVAAAMPFTAAKEMPRLPGGIPILGHILEMQRDFPGLLDRAREFGDVCWIQIADKRCAIINDPALIEYVLVENPKNYSKRTHGYNQMRKMLGNGLVTSEGSFWLRQRRIAQPAFHREKLGHFATIMQRDTEELLAQWPDGEIEFAGEMMSLTMRIIGELLFSVDVRGDTDSAGSAITELLHQVTVRTTSVFNWPDGVPTSLNRRFFKAKKTMDDLTSSIIGQRRAGERKPDLLSMLMDAVDEETGERMNDQQLRDECVTLFIAGHETTSTALAWTLYELLRHPDIEATLRAEIAANSDGDAPIPLEKLMRMPYLDAVLKEGMRLHPPIWLVARCAEVDDVVAGYALPKGYRVFISQWAMHRHPRYWPEPLRFHPERFLVEDERRPKYAYFPFLGGPRKCIGDQLAILEAKVILAALLRRVRFALVPGHRVVMDPTPTLRMKHGMRVTVQRA